MSINMQKSPPKHEEYPMNLNRLNEILAGLGKVKIAVVGDFFLDRYWDINTQLDELSVETGLVAWQVERVRVSPGAAGTVVNNLAALKAGTIYAVGFVGNDGEGYELCKLLDNLGVDRTHLHSTDEQRTPCYTKPLREGVEMNRVDIKNRKPTSHELEQQIIQSLRQLAKEVDAILIMDQVSEPNCGVITANVRDMLIELGQKQDSPIIYADSREGISAFRHIIIKCNDREATEAFDLYTGESPDPNLLEECGLNLARRTEKIVFITMGSRGQLVVDLNAEKQCTLVPAIPVEGEIDICGAGDASSSAIVGALAAGATPAEASFLGNIASSITIRKIGETGTASPGEILDVFRSNFGS